MKNHAATKHPSTTSQVSRASWRLGSLPLVVFAALAVSSSCTTPFDNTGYCSVTNGNAFCEAHHGDDGRSYCIWGSLECRARLAQDYVGEGDGFDGCIAEPPPPGGDSCYSPCGGGLDFEDVFSCPDGELPATSTMGGTDSGSNETVEVSTTAGIETSSSSDSTNTTSALDSSTGTPPSCDVDGDCVDDPGGPFCDPVLGVCVTCNDLGGNSTCAEANPERPICDPATHQCVSCTAHEECSVGACHIFAGTCFPDEGPGGSVVFEVNDVAADIAADIAMGVPPGGYGIVILEGLGSDMVYEIPDPISVEGNRIIAILDDGYGAPRPAIHSAAGSSPAISVAAGSTLYLQGLDVSGHTDANVLPVECSGPNASIDVRGTAITANAVGVGIAQCEARFSNCFLQSMNTDEPVIDVGGNSSAEIVYGTLFMYAGGDGGRNDVISCANENSITIRNSLIISMNGDSEEIDASCSTGASTITLEHTIIESPPSFGIGVGNDVLEPPFSPMGPNYAEWFCGDLAGNLHLNTEAISASFDADNIVPDIDHLLIAVPSAEDETRDIDGDDRGISAMVGADVPLALDSMFCTQP